MATALRVSQAHEDLREHYDLMIENVRLREEVERIVRHDLKNPLSAIIGMAARLSRQDNLSSEQNKQVKAIERSAYDMLDLINCSSELFKMEQGDYCLQPHPVDLEALIERVAEESRLAFSGKEISFLNEIIPCCEEDGCKGFQGDPLMLYSMLHNLVKNAAEASRPGETVRLELVCGNPTRIRIHNPGRVPAEVCGRFFEKYSTYGKQGGTGLGTYSAKLICEAHGGRIAMETSDEAGTVITVELACTDHRL